VAVAKYDGEGGETHWHSLIEILQFDPSWKEQMKIWTKRLDHGSNHQISHQISRSHIGDVVHGPPPLNAQSFQ